MNLALPALIVFLVLLPGFAFRSGLKRAERTSLDFSPFGSVVAEAVFWAIVVHTIWLAASYVLAERELNAFVLMGLVSSSPPTQAEATRQIATEFRWVAAYFLSLFVAANLLPGLIRKGISKFRLDRDASPLSVAFRFHEAPWYYLLTGADFAEEDQPDLIIISAIVEVAKEAVLYVGLLDDFYFDSDGQLDRLILRKVSRRPMASDKALDGGDQIQQRFYPIDGDNFVLRYSETITLNVQYLRLTTSGSSTVSEPQGTRNVEQSGAEN